MLCSFCSVENIIGAKHRNLLSIDVLQVAKL